MLVTKFVALLVALALVLVPSTARAVPTSDEVWSRGEWATSADANHYRILSVGTTAIATSPFPSGGVCWCDVVVTGTSDIQWSVGATVPSTTSCMGSIPARTIGSIPLAFRIKERTAFTTLRLHATTGTANTVIIVWP